VSALVQGCGDFLPGGSLRVLIRGRSEIMKGSHYLQQFKLQPSAVIKHPAEDPLRVGIRRR
jgi:hypothetical protein